MHQALSFLDSRAAPIDPTAGMYDTTAVRGGRCIHSPSYPLLSSPRAAYPRDDPHAQRSRSLFFITGPALRRLMRRPSASPRYHQRRSIPTRLTSRLHTLGARRAALDAVRGRGARCSYPHVHRAAPHQSPPRWSVACAIRDYHWHWLSQGTVYNPTTPREISHATTTPPHAARDVLVDPDAAFVATPRCATVLTGVPPSPADARACRALQYYPQHIPRAQRAPRLFLIAGVAFFAFTYATTIYCPHRSTRTAGHIPNTTPTSPARATAALHRARRSSLFPVSVHLG
ncbi:hypothetical protein K438DRAFT_1999563 [Mycena galopus ATCC 62051]|nr:hypothetical protein K438DRAFT_1999563 [Mycena galopus ATCC 62051]